MSVRNVASALLLFLLVAGVAAEYCPPNCQCTNGTIDCLKCLQAYFRVYHTNTSSCVCMHGFKELTPIGSHCCPANCSVCSDFAGCVACPKKWKVHANYVLWVGICICQDNYFHDGSDCMCLSSQLPQSYYEDVAAVVCYSCPEGCTCNESGCASCSPSTYRAVTSGPTGKLICDCVAPYKLFNGACVCPKLCVCNQADGSITCDPASYRSLSRYGIWQCPWPYTDTNYQCVCAGPYINVNATMLQAYNPQQSCMCNSVVLFQDFYINRQAVCQTCQYWCSCNQNGCYYCPPTTGRVANGNTCDCVKPYTEFGGVCTCAEPHYNNGIECKCLSEYNSTGYVLDLPEGECYTCPEGCQCDASGCYNCISAALRLVVQRAQGYSCRTCQPFASLVDGVCRCNLLSTYQDGSCNCTSLDGYYRDFTASNVCLKCPAFCNCTAALGCYSCEAAAFRTIVTDGSGYSVCKCKFGSVVNITGGCGCVGFYNATSDACDCQAPYYLTQAGECSCLSDLDPFNYYFDYDAHQCYACPYGCICNSSGCFHCDPNSLRYHYTFNNKRFCPCQQNAILWSGVCRRCPPQYYFLNGNCIQCPECQTCNLGGCTSCKDGFTLVNGACTCQYSGLVNIGGLCRCPMGQYFSYDLMSCEACPPQCFDCLNATSCLTCATGVNRMNSPILMCPCLPNYRQLGEKKNYCCSDTCFTCNLTGCISCLMNTYRTLNPANQTCLCINNLVEIPNQIPCGCPDGSYLFNDNKCYSCPPNCLTCSFNKLTQAFLCSSCRHNMNRNTSSETCQCLPNFSEAWPRLEFCTPDYCQNYQKRCTQCAVSSNRVPSNDGTACICARGFYQSQYGTCVDCGMEGCLACATVNYCLECNQTKGYMLVSKLCQQPVNASSTIYSQSYTGITLQTNTSMNVSQNWWVASVEGRLTQIYNRTEADAVLDESIPLELLFSYLNPNGILTVKFGNAAVEKTNMMLELRYVITTNSTSRLLATSLESKVYVYCPRVMTSAQLNPVSSWHFQLEMAFVALLLLISIAIYVRGYKHNQIMFYLQTLAFIAFMLKDDSFDLCVFLFNLSFSYYSFLSNAYGGLIPKGYLQPSQGNFQYFTTDANILRVAGNVLVISSANLVLISLSRGLYYCVKRILEDDQESCVNSILKNRKYFYRFVEFVYKTCMYPALFFSFVTLDNWRLGSTILSNNTTFQYLCRALCIVLPAGYLATTIWQLINQTVSKIYKLENVIEFVSAVLAAMIIALSVNKPAYVAVFVVFLLRALAYLYVRKTYLRDFQRFEYIKGISTLLEMFTFWVLPSMSTATVIVFMLLTICSQMTHIVTVMVFTDKKAKKVKPANLDTLSISSDNVCQLPSVIEVTPKGNSFSDSTN